MALAWITYRTAQSVINIKDGRWAPTKAAIRDLLSALRSGKLVAHGMFEGERIPHPIETAVWSTFEIVVKRMTFAGQKLPTSGTPVVIAQRIGPPQTPLLSATVPAAKVRKLWPAAKPTAAAATRCQKHLLTEMKRSPDRSPKSKSDLLADCQARFPGLSPSYSPKIAAWRDLRQDFARGAWRVDRVRRLMTRRLGLILLGWKFRRGVGCGDGAALAMALRRRAVRRVRGRQRGRDKRWARRHGCEPRLPPRARRS